MNAPIDTQFRQLRQGIAQRPLTPGVYHPDDLLPLEEV